MRGADIVAMYGVVVAFSASPWLFALKPFRPSLRCALASAVVGFALLLLTPGASEAAIGTKYSSIVINADSGAVLHQHNPDTRHYPASITKLMTLYLVFEALETRRFTLSSTIKVSARAARQPASKLGLKRGESIRIRDAILALAVKSANDVASAVAEAISGTERKFGYLMTDKAQALGMKNTRFRNASGLPNRRQLSTAGDLAKLLRALRRDFPQYYGYLKVRSFTFRGQRFNNHSRLLDHYAGTDGVKTGFIRASGFNLAASAERDGIRLIAVVLGTRSPRARDLHTMGLLERGFEAATNGQYRAFQYDRNIHVTRKRQRINKRVRVQRARGARGRIRLSRLTPPSPPDFRSGSEQGSAASLATGKQPGHARSAPGDAVWSIQIGTFSNRALALKAAREAKRSLPNILRQTRPKIDTVKLDSGRGHRARLMGLSRSAAFEACRMLAAGNRSCLPVDAGGRFAAK